MKPPCKRASSSNKLAHKAESDYGDSLSQRNVGDAHCVERDAAQRGEAGVLEGDVVRNSRNQIASDKDSFSVSGSFASVGDTMSDVESVTVPCFSTTRPAPEYPNTAYSLNLAFTSAKVFSGPWDLSTFPDFAELGRIV